MSGLHLDTALIPNLETSQSYVGSGSTWFSSSVLFINNGLAQGFGNTMYTVSDSSSHTQGFNVINLTQIYALSGGPNHAEGVSLTLGQYNRGGNHIEGANNIISNVRLTHTEGVRNTINAGVASVISMGPHAEGSSHTLSVSNNTSTIVHAYHVEGVSHSIDPSFQSQNMFDHFEGFKNLLLSRAGHSTHMEGANNTFRRPSNNTNHFEGVNNIDYPGSNTSNTHYEGYLNTCSTTNISNLTQPAHIEGINNSSIIRIGHVQGINHSTYNSTGYNLVNSTFNLYVEGIGHSGLITSNIPTTANFQQYYFGHYQTSSLVITGSAGNLTGSISVYCNIGGGLNNSQRASIAEFIKMGYNNFNQTTSSLILTWVSESGNFANDTLAATGGVPIGGIYRSESYLKIRLS